MNLTTQAQLETWAENNAHYKKGYTGKHFSQFVCHIMNMFDRRVRSCECEWISPYGRVISADCELHD